MEGHLAHEKWNHSCISRYKFTEVDKKIVGPETFSLIFVQLGFFKKTKDECVDVLDQWLYCLKHMYELDDLPDSFDLESGLVNLRDASEIAAFDESKKLTYIAEEMTEMDYRHDMYWSRKKGFEAGVAQGREEGALKGILDVALRMLKDGMPIQQVAQYSGLSEEQVLALANEN